MKNRYIHYSRSLIQIALILLIFASCVPQKKIKYLQNNIITYPDYAWGDGDILIDYKCSLGVPVNQYRSGYKTYILLSLREVKNKGDTDVYNIQWRIKNGFLVLMSIVITGIAMITFLEYKQITKR